LNLRPTDYEELKELGRMFLGRRFATVFFCCGVPGSSNRNYTETGRECVPASLPASSRSATNFADRTPNWDRKCLPALLRTSRAAQDRFYADIPVICGPISREENTSALAACISPAEPGTSDRSGRPIGGSIGKMVGPVGLEPATYQL